MTIAAWMILAVAVALSSTGCATVVVDEHGGSAAGDATSSAATGGATSGASTSTGEAPPGACTALEGKTFASVSELECGRGPDGVALCHWHLTFKADAAGETIWSWQHSDYGESGTVQCAGSTLTAQSSGPGGMYTGTYDAAPKKLTWDMVTYTLVP